MDYIERIDKVMNEVFSGNYDYVVEDYPADLEESLELALNYENKGLYDGAIDIYLFIFNSKKTVYIDIMHYIYACAILSAKIELAYKTIVYAEMLKKNFWAGHRPIIAESFKEVRLRSNFEKMLFEIYNIPFIKDDSRLSRKEQIINEQNLNKKINLYYELVRKQAGSYSTYNALPKMKALVFIKQIDNCRQLYDYFHNGYGHLLWN